MKQLFTFLSLTFLTLQMTAQTIDISAARMASLGQTVTISGIVTNGAELGVIRYMQDATAGLPVYDPSFAAVANRGDSVTITGEMTIFNGLLELINTSWTIHTTGNTLPAPFVVANPSGVNISNEGELVQINDVTFSNPGGTFTSGTLSFTDGNQTSQIYLGSSHSILGSIIPQTPVNLVGLSAQFNSTPQLILRDAADIQIASNFYLTTGTEQTNITNSGFDLSWETNANGSSNVEYGLTDALGTHIAAGGSTTNHTVNLSGLSAGEIYYARAYSIDGTDTAFSVTRVYATISNSTGTVEVYFNQPVNTSINTGTSAVYLDGAGLEAKLIEYIDNAQTSIDIAAYNQSRNAIVFALNNAVNRGVIVRVIGDDETGNLALQNNTTNFSWFIGNADGLMHNKFMIVDVDSENDSWVFMGSMNLTGSDMYNNYNSCLFIQDQSLAKGYTIEFNEMWGTDTPTFGLFTRKLGANKVDNTPKKYIIGGIEMESYFSPSDGTTAAIGKALATADSKIEFALLTFTRNDLRDALIDRHNAGIGIRGMIENVNDNGGEFQNLLNAGINVRDDSVAHLLHHKYAIVDADDVSSDPLVITGSHNWTTSAESTNDENTLIIHDATIANLYTQEFSARWIGIATNTRNVVSGIEGFETTILGNPVRNTLRFTMDNQVSNEVNVSFYNIQGQLLTSQELNNTFGSTTHQIDVNNFSSGQYIVIFRIGELAVGEKFIIQK